MRRFAVLLLLAFGAWTALLALGSYGIGPIVITREGEQNVILSFMPPRAVTEPGWSLRFPFVEEAKTYERRLMYLNTEPDVIQTKDQERIVVDNYVMWQILDPIQFRSSFPQGLGQAEKQIDRVVRAGVREIVGKSTLTDVLTDQRLEIMEQIREGAVGTLSKSGVVVKDIRINRTDLPPGIERNVYARMQTERERLARKHRAEGEEKARRIRAEADREARLIVAEAHSKSEIARGEGDAEATRIYAEAFNQDPEFFSFVRSLEAYRKTIGEGTTLVLSPDSEFFQYFGHRLVSPKGGPPE